MVPVLEFCRFGVTPSNETVQPSASTDATVVYIVVVEAVFGAPEERLDGAGPEQTS